MKIKANLYILLLGLAVLTLPGLAKASGDITLKSVTLSSLVDITQKTFTVTAGGADLLVSYTAATKVTGNPTGLTSYSDWQLTDQLNITGSITGYQDGKLKLTAQTIAYNFSNRQLKTITGYVSNVDGVNNIVWVSIKTGNQYNTLEIDKVGVSDGARLIGFNNLNQVTPGQAVSLTQIWNKTNKNLMKTAAISKLGNKANVHIISLRRESGNFIVESGYPQPLQLKRGDILIIQNRTGVTLYFKADAADQGKFSPRLTDKYSTLKSVGQLQYSIPAGSISGSFVLPLKTEAVATANTVLNLQLQITD